MTEDWQLIPTSATFESPSSAALINASGFAEYVYREPAVSRTPCASVTTAGSASHERSSDSFDVQAPSISPLASPQISSADTTPPS